MSKDKPKKTKMPSPVENPAIYDDYDPAPGKFSNSVTFQNTDKDTKRIAKER